MFKPEDIFISRINYAAPQYWQVWELRETVLRKPIGLSLKNENLDGDQADIIFIAEYNSAVIGCLMLRHINETQLQLRQMAVYNDWQGKGIGRMLVLAAEKYASGKGYDKMTLHARKVAVGFYSGLGYSTFGDEFTEVGIPHFMMEKALGRD